jgi:hypothetical protein
MITVNLSEAEVNRLMLLLWDAEKRATRWDDRADINEIKNKLRIAHDSR